MVTLKDQGLVALIIPILGDGEVDSMTITVTIDEGSELMREITYLRAASDAHLDMWRAFSDECRDEIRMAEASRKDGEPTIYF